MSMHAMNCSLELQPTNVSQRPSDGRLFHIIGADKQKLCGP